MQHSVSLTGPQYDELINAAVAVGRSLLENGAEIYRVEESIQRILLAYGVLEADVFAIPSCIIVSLTRGDGSVLTKTKRIFSTSVNLDKIDRLNDLCRRICKECPSFAVVEQELCAIAARRVFPLWVLVLCFAGVSAAFTLFFGGMLQDAACALVLGACVKLSTYHMNKLNANGFFVNMVGSAVAATLAAVAVWLGLGVNLDKMIIGTFMTMVPGVAITNSMRDIIAGDLIAGLTTTVKAVLVATAMALGAALALLVAKYLWGITP